MAARIATLLLLSLVLGTRLAGAETANLITLLPVAVLDDSKPAMNSDKKGRLQAIAYRVAVNPSFFLAPSVRLKPITRTVFSTREEMPDPETGQAKRDMKVNYSCALVEVLDGANKGRKGWVVLSREVVDRYSDVWIGPEPEPQTETPRR